MKNGGDEDEDGEEENNHENENAADKMENPEFEEDEKDPFYNEEIDQHHDHDHDHAVYLVAPIYY